jgi:hypothetical protein
MNRVIFPLVAVATLFIASTEAKAFGLLNRMMGNDCCGATCCEATCAAAEPACGCAAEPACGCAAEPACGCAAEPSCGCAPSCCDNGCCRKRCTPIRDLLARLHCHLHRCCNSCDSCCEASCGCAAEPACGCAAPSCGCAR